jgi:hypothetical protein
MTRSRNAQLARARRVERRASERRALKQARADYFGTRPAKRMTVPQEIRQLTGKGSAAASGSPGQGGGR